MTADPRDALSQDELLMAWQKIKNDIETLKKSEMDLRKYIATRAFPEKREGTNTLDLGNGYSLKGKIKYNYNLDNDNAKIQAGLEKLAKTGNDGSFIAERMVSWKPNFLLSEYRPIQADAAEGNELAKKRLMIISEFLTIDEAAPELEIKEPSKGNK